MVYHRHIFSTRRIQGKPNMRRRKRENIAIEMQKEWFEMIEKKVDINPAVKIAEKIAQEFRRIIGRDIRDMDKHNIRIVVEKTMKNIETDAIYSVVLKVKNLYVDFDRRFSQNVGIKIGENSITQSMARMMAKKVATQVDNSMGKLNADFYAKFIEQISDKDMTAYKLEKWLREELKKVRKRIEMIARTVLGSAYNMIASNNYDRIASMMGENPMKEYYEWINPLDNRTTDICREIVARSKGGLTKSELIELIREVSNKYLGHFWNGENPFLPHPNCRSTMKWVYYGGD